MFPSPADSARMDSSGTTSPSSIGANAPTGQRYQGNTSSLYPDLSSSTLRSAPRDYEEDEDILATMSIPPAKSKPKPVRPPPPRNHSVPSDLPSSKKSRSSVSVLHF